MVYSYSGKTDRKYRYYVCLNAQRKGWAVCPAKSVPARQIEDSVLAQIHATQPDPSTSVEWERLEATERVAAMQNLVERISFHGATGQVCIRLRSTAEGREQI